MERFIRKFLLRRLTGEDEIASPGRSLGLHASEDIVSIDYVGKRWSLSRCEPWPEYVAS